MLHHLCHPKKTAIGSSPLIPNIGIRHWLTELTEEVNGCIILSDKNVNLVFFNKSKNSRFEIQSK
jgi:hypothetical protein